MGILSSACSSRLQPSAVILMDINDVASNNSSDERRNSSSQQPRSSMSKHSLYELPASNTTTDVQTDLEARSERALGAFREGSTSAHSEGMTAKSNSNHEIDYVPSAIVVTFSSAFFRSCPVELLRYIMKDESLKCCLYEFVARSADSDSASCFRPEKQAFDIEKGYNLSRMSILCRELEQDIIDTNWLLTQLPSFIVSEPFIELHVEEYRRASFVAAGLRDIFKRGRLLKTSSFSTGKEFMMYREAIKAEIPTDTVIGNALSIISTKEIKRLVQTEDWFFHLIALVERLPVGVTISNAADAERLPFVYANLAFAEMTGFARPDIIGQPFSFFECLLHSNDYSRLMRKRNDDEIFSVTAKSCRKEEGEYYDNMAFKTLKDRNGNNQYIFGLHFPSKLSKLEAGVYRKLAVRLVDSLPSIISFQI